MTVDGSTGVPLDVADPSGPRRRKALAMVLILAGALLSVGLWQWRSPDAFAEQGGVQVGLYSPVGTTALFGVATPAQDMDPAVLTVHTVEPQVTEGNARVDVLVCHRRPGAGGIGAARGEQALNRFCESPAPPDGVQLTPGDDLILRVRSEEPGRVVVEGIKVTYSHGWRRGSQVTGLTAMATFGTETVRDHLDGG